MDVAIVQAGTMPKDPPKDLEAVAGIYYEPVMVFYRGNTALTRLEQLRGKKIAIGAEGSGVRPLAQMLLADSGVNDGADGTTFEPLGTGDAVNGLAANEIDAAFFVIAPDASDIAKLFTIASLLQDPKVIEKPDLLEDAASFKELKSRLGVSDKDLPDDVKVRGKSKLNLMSFEHAHAYSRRHPFLSPVTLYKGSIDIAKNLPPQDVQLVAGAATLVVRHSAHEAIIQLLVRAAEHIHSQGTLLSEPGTFPNSDRCELPVNSDAHYFLTTKPGFLQRTFPFWLASLIDRMLILVLPLLALFLPLIRMMPPLYAWRTRSRIYKWYKQVRRFDERLSEHSQRAEIITGRDELASLEKTLLSVKVPLSYTEEPVQPSPARGLRPHPAGGMVEDAGVGGAIRDRALFRQGYRLGMHRGWASRRILQRDINHSPRAKHS